MQKQRAIVIYSWKRFAAALLVAATLLCTIIGFCVSRVVRKQYHNELYSNMVSMSDSTFNC